MRGEEVVVLKAFERMRAGAPRALLVIAPRHPERFDEVERLARDEGFRTARRTQLAIDEEPRADVVILDTIGELAQLYQVATVVFVGGSLVPTRRAQHPRAGGLRQADPVRPAHAELQGDCRDVPRPAAPRSRCATSGSSRRPSGTCCDDAARRSALGRAAQAIVEANHGARERTLDAIAALLPLGGAPKVRPFRVVQVSRRARLEP